jgi:hypothetical protein
MPLLDNTGRQIPFWFEDILDYASIATTDFDPIATYVGGSKATSDLSKLNKYIKGGFGVKNATDNSGYIYAVTWAQFQDYISTNRGVVPANYTLAGIVPRQIFLASGEWCLTPIVKVFKDNDGTYASTVATINTGRIL